MYASDYRRIGRQSLAGNWWLSVLICFVASLFAGGGFRLEWREDAESILQLYPALEPAVTALSIYAAISGIVSFLIGGTVTLGKCRFFLDLHDRKPLQFQTLFSQFHQFGNGFCLQLLTGIFTTLWTLLFIIPGIVAACRYAMAPYIQAEHPEYTAMESIRASKAMMIGHKWEYFCLIMSFLGWILLCALTLGIGDFFLRPYVAASDAAFYRQLCSEQAVRPEN